MECGISWCRGENLADQTGIFLLELKYRGDGVWIVLAVYLAGANGGMKQEFRRTVYKLLACLMVAAVLVDRK